MSTQVIERSKKVKRNRKNKKSNIKIYCQGINGRDWTDVKVLEAEGKEGHYQVRSGNKVLAEGSEESCKTYLQLCTKASSFKKILDKAKDKEKLYKKPDVRALAKLVVKLSRIIRIADPSGTIRSAHHMVRGLTDAYYDKREKERQEEQARKEAEEAAKEARAETIRLIAEVENRLCDGEKLTDLSDLLDLIDSNMSEYGLWDLRRQRENLTNVALIGSVYRTTQPADAQLVAVA